MGPTPGGTHWYLAPCPLTLTVLGPELVLTSEGRLAIRSAPFDAGSLELESELILMAGGTFGLGDGSFDESLGDNGFGVESEFMTGGRLGL